MTECKHKNRICARWHRGLKAVRCVECGAFAGHRDENGYWCWRRPNLEAERDDLSARLRSSQDHAREIAAERDEYKSKMGQAIHEMDCAKQERNRAETERDALKGGYVAHAQDGAPITTEELIEERDALAAELKRVTDDCHVHARAYEREKVARRVNEAGLLADKESADRLRSELERRLPVLERKIDKMAAVVEAARDLMTAADIWDHLQHLSDALAALDEAGDS